MRDNRVTVALADTTVQRQVVLIGVNQLALVKGNPASPVGLAQRLVPLLIGCLLASEFRRIQFAQVAPHRFPRKLRRALVALLGVPT